uniref:Putative acetoacetyl-coa synthetase n=1 Tax=Moniliophthora roreri TaxID=221103 RepID=A0A0W0FJZ4_MONRR
MDTSTHLSTSQADIAPLYQPPNSNTAIHRFRNRVNSKYDLSLSSYHDLYKWSVTLIDDFWSTVWEETNVIGHMGGHVVDKGAKPSDNPAWFTDARINWAQNMLQCRSSTKLALIQPTEPTLEHPTPPLRSCTYGDLYELVSSLVSAFLENGLKPGDRVASYSSNCIENVAACLATTALGGIWVSAAADFGPEGVLERFEQVQPAFIFAVDAVVYNAKVHDHLGKVSSLLSALDKVTETKPRIVIIHAIPYSQEDRTLWKQDWISWTDFVNSGKKAGLGRDEHDEILWYQGSFNDPLWILFSSGTTGRPKPIVHRTGGMLLQARKEFSICADVTSDDVFFYYTTTQWLDDVELPDGSPLRDPAYLWRLVDELGISIFGTSAKYIDTLSKNYRPRENHSLQSLRHIYSTGSPLAPQLYDYVYRYIHPNVLLGSITGGTDICSLFAGMCSALPVYRGELQCRMLGMAVEAFDATGKACLADKSGELVCVKPFPCMPAGFWPLPGFGTDAAVKSAGERFRQAYFAEFDGVWYHGDHITITRSRHGNGGGVVMLGRSDGVLNPGGVRFGSAELYDVIEHNFAEEVQDCLAIGQSIENGTDERVLLLVKLADGVSLSGSLENDIKAQIRSRRSPRHVPAKVIQVKDIPYTLNGKRVEVLVKKIINGATPSTINPATLSNPGCLEFYFNLGEVLREEVEKK